MKSLLISIFLFSSLYGAISEFKSDDYQILIGKNFDDEALDIVEDYDYNISVIGYTQDYQTSSKSSGSFHNAFDYLSSIQAKNGEQLRIIKLNPSANIVNDKSFALKEYNRGTNILKTVQNGYLIGGYTHNGQMIISSLDAQAKPSYIKQFGTANFDQLHALISLSEGGSVAIGTSQTSRNTHDNMFVQGLGKSDVYLVKYKENGQVRWKKKYGSSNKDIGIDGAGTSDGGFILLGLSQEGKDFILSASKINDTGDIVWIKKFPKVGRQNAFKIIKTIRGNYLISASFENKDNQDNIRLIHIDNEGNILWERSYYNDAHEHLNDISVDFKGNIIAVGYSQNSSQANLDALVRYYDHKGNIIWERKFGKDRHDAFKSVTLLHDNTFAIAGFSTSFADKKRQIWILKLNDDGSLVKKKVKEYKDIYNALENAFVSTGKKQNIKPEELSKFNTSTNTVSESPKQTEGTKTKVSIYKDLRITHDSLIFKQGSSTLTAKHKTILKEFIPRLMKTLEPYKDQIKNIQIQGYTSSEWHAPETQRYLNNAKLANERALSVLDYSYKLKAVKEHKNWMTQVFSTDGYSYSNLVYEDDKENKIRSRRVEFEIILK